MSTVLARWSQVPTVVARGKDGVVSDGRLATSLRGGGGTAAARALNKMTLLTPARFVRGEGSCGYQASRHRIASSLTTWVPSNDGEPDAENEPRRGTKGWEHSVRRRSEQIINPSGETDRKHFHPFTLHNTTKLAADEPEGEGKLPKNSIQLPMPKRRAELSFTCDKCGGGRRICCSVLSLTFFSSFSPCL